MPLRIEIEDAKFGTRNAAGVTSRGQLITAPLKFNETFFQSLDVASTPFNIITPRTNQQFVIDGYIVSSNKDVSSTNGAVISIYEASAPDTLTVNRQLFLLDLGRLDRASESGLNVITSQGSWINCQTDDTTTNVTLLGYYVDIET
jgi:hypothetical protein